MEYGAAREDELEGIAWQTAHAFGGTPAYSERWLETYREDVRVLRVDGQTTGSLLRIPMGQFFGGRSVPMCGVAGVVMHGARRGRGHATTMMSEAVREMRKDGFALSALYASTAKLYRRAGWECAGRHWRTTLPARELPRESSLPAREFAPADQKHVRRLYKRHAKLRDGWLDRTRYIWPRTRRVIEDRPVYGFLVGPAEAPEGYVFYRLRPAGELPAFDLEVTDYAHTTGRAARRILGLLAEHRSLAGEVRTSIPADAPLLTLLPDHRVKSVLKEQWMLRVLDVPRALEARGYPRGLSLRFVLRVDDDQVRANHRGFVVRIERGRAEVKAAPRGKKADARLCVGTLASIYTGFADPLALGAVGQVDGSRAALEKLRAAFAGSPDLVDFF